MAPHMSNSNNSSPTIGVFDSGIGGLTVLRAIADLVPSADLVYFGDTARVPYGNKSRDTIVRYSMEIAQFLISKDIDLLVVACNTASAYALEVLRDNFNLPIIGVIVPGARKAVEVTRNGHVGILGTKGTIVSGAYEKAIKEMSPHVDVTSIACPLLVPLIEEGLLDHLATRLILREYLDQLQSRGIDTLVLGCTHYPLMRDLIAEEIGPGIQIVDSATTCATEVRANIASHAIEKPGICSYFVSDDPVKFKQMGEKLLNRCMPSVELAAEQQCYA